MPLSCSKHTNEHEINPPGNAGHDLAIHLRCAYLAMHRATNACFAAYGISADSFTLLMALKDHGPLTQKDLVHKIGSDANTVSAMLKRLEKLQFIQRNQDELDARIRVAKLTAEGQKILAMLWEESQELRIKMENLFQPREMEDLVLSLKQITQVMNTKMDEGRDKNETL